MDKQNRKVVEENESQLRGKPGLGKKGNEICFINGFDFRN